MEPLNENKNESPAKISNNLIKIDFDENKSSTPKEEIKSENIPQLPSIQEEDNSNFIFGSQGDISVKKHFKKGKF